MSKVNVILPQMGQGVEEATLIEYKCAVGDTIRTDDVVAEIATDKVDTEVTSPADGVVESIMFKKDDVIRVGQVMAVIETGHDEPSSAPQEENENIACEETSSTYAVSAHAVREDYSSATRFYSPLVRNMAKVEGIPLSEMEKIKGTGLNGRVTKDDMIAYIQGGRKYKNSAAEAETLPDEVIPMSRMRRIIAQNMMNSIAVSAHATSFSCVDVTVLSQWRKRIRAEFLSKHGEKLTYTPVFMMAVAQALAQYPKMNASVQGENILQHKHINIGMAVALPTGDLIVPVIHDADRLSLPQMAAEVNDLAGRARENKLRPDEIQGGTFTVTNVGSFGTLFGTPIINQPEVAVLAIGAIEKIPAVITVDGSDAIAIREHMYLSMSYDHRVIDGGYAGMFMKKITGYLENWDAGQTV